MEWRTRMMFLGSAPSALAAVLTVGGCAIEEPPRGGTLGKSTFSVLDPAFGSGGVVVTKVAGGSSQINALALQGDGGIVAAAALVPADEPKSAVVLRWLADGGADTSWGSGGVAMPFGSDSAATSIVAHDDGTVAVAGYAHD